MYVCIHVQGLDSEANNCVRMVKLSGWRRQESCGFGAVAEWMGMICSSAVQLTITALFACGRQSLDPLSHLWLE